MSQSTLVLNSAGIQAAVDRMAREISGQLDNGNKVGLVGIQRGGVFLAERLAHLLSRYWSRAVPVGRLDISMHRDDLDQRAAPQVRPTVIPFDITDMTIVLVDDVLFNGRTTRAALDALNDFGRPKRIQLAVLIDRGHRELPIRADFVGQEVDTALTDTVDVRLHEEGGEEAVYLKSA
jgi:pyrimidine operon attenuation protein/uracil phosphoribosyltransferase